MNKATFRAGRYVSLNGSWYAAVNVHIADEGSWEWSTACNTRWGAGVAAKRHMKRLKRAYERGELVLP